MPRWIPAAVVLAVAGTLLWRAFANVDVHEAGRAIVAIGPLAPLLLVPFALAMALDALGVRRLLAAGGRAAPFGRLLAIRIGTEALHLSTPAGFAVADAAAARLLDTQCAVPLGEGVTVAVARRWLVMRAHFGYIVLGAALGWATLAAVSMRLFGVRALPWAILASAFVPLAMSTALGASIRGGRLVALFSSAASRVPWAWLRDRAERAASGAGSVHACMARIGAARAAAWTATAAFFGCWLLESCDTAIVLRLLGAPPAFALAIAVEVGISLLKAVGNVAPAGLGVQDAGYAALLPAMGVSAETAAAFVVVKRAKEVVWIAVGYGLLALHRRPVAMPVRFAPAWRSALRLLRVPAPKAESEA
jgi:uncharacterized membrane protein YbhN (UPF0104 family)